MAKMEFEFKPDELMLKVNDNSNKLEHLQSLIAQHMDFSAKTKLELKESILEIKSDLKELSRKVDSEVKIRQDFMNQSKGALWVSGKFWILLTAFGGTIATAWAKITGKL